jgi:stage II sporulation protein M
MRINRVSDSFGVHLQKNFWLYMISLLCLCTGIVLGIYTVKYMGDFEKTDLLNYFINFGDYISSTNVNNRFILFETVKNNIPVIFILWLLGLTVVGIPIVLIINIIKGFTIGFTITFAISGMGVKGIWISMIGVLPQNIVYIPCTIICSVLAMELSLSKIMDKSHKTLSLHKSTGNINYSITFFIITLAMFLGFIIEAYLTPNLIRDIIIGIGSVII